MKLTFYGGFHNSSEITINIAYVPTKAIWEVIHNDSYIPEFIEEYCSEYQREKLRKHFCGIRGCTCGSYYLNVHYMKH
jgi:hypothetical protein